MLSATEIVRLYEVEKLSTYDISEIDGRSSVSIRNQLKSNGVVMRSRVEALALVVSDIWPDDKVAILRREWPTKPVHEIAKMLGMTGGAVWGKADRLGLPSRSGGRAPKLAKQPKPASVISNVVRLPVPRPRPEPVLGPVHHCRWPEGDPKEQGFHFCEAPCREGSSYCPDHHARAYQPKAVAAE